MRYKKIMISGDLIVNLSIQGEIFAAKCVKGLPPGTRFCYAIPDIYYSIWIVVEHESFPMLKDGDIIPDFDKPEFERLGVVKP